MFCCTSTEKENIENEIFAVLVKKTKDNLSLTLNAFQSSKLVGAAMIRAIQIPINDKIITFIFELLLVTK